MESYQKVTSSELCQNLVPDFGDTTDTSSSNRFYITRYTSQGEEFKTRIKHVWLQGHVINSSAGEEVLEVSDEATVTDAKTVESVIVVNGDKVPNKTPFKGRYCQILGDVLGIDLNSKIRIRAVKIVDIDQDPVLKLSWPLEVEEYRRVFFNVVMMKI